MTQTIKNKGCNLDQESGLESESIKIQGNLREQILNYLFRNIMIITRRERIRAIPSINYREMSSKLKIDIRIIHKFISRFLVDLIRIKQFINKNGYIGHSRNQFILVKTYLHRLYRLAPVFDYERARQNAKILKLKLDALYFWPHVTTQAAVIIYITDKLDLSQRNKILQTNLRVFCNCSSYAFHRTRNRLGLNKQK